MTCNISSTPDFKSNLNVLCKRYKSMKQDFSNFLDELEKNPFQGSELGKGLRKIRMAITSKGKGKSGGARVITVTAIVSVDETNVTLLTIYDKSDRETIKDSELKKVLKKNGLI